MFSEYKVLQKCFYDEVAPIWMDRARQGLQRRIFRILFFRRTACFGTRISF